MADPLERLRTLHQVCRHFVRAKFESSENVSDLSIFSTIHYIETYLRLCMANSKSILLKSPIDVCLFLEGLQSI